MSEKQNPKPLRSGLEDSVASVSSKESVPEAVRPSGRIEGEKK
jgi:hypothetical protein